jgi:MFS family permease
VRAVSRSIASNPSLALLWISRLLSVISVQVLTVAVGWQLYELTNDPLDLGLVGLFQFLPIVSLTLVVGSVADRYDRRLIVAACRVVQCACTAVLAIGSAGDWISAGVIFTVVAVVGCALAFENPTVTALLPGLVPRHEFSRAMVSYSTASQLARISGPAIGGLLYLLGPTVAYGVGAALFLVAALSMIPLRIQRSVSSKAPITLGSVFAGLAFTRRTPVILGSISLDLFVVLLGGATALLPIYARDILQTGPEGLGLLRSATAAGALLMSGVLMLFPISRQVGPLLFGAVIVFGLATIVFGLSTSLPLSIAALMVLGASNVISVVIRHSVMQLRTPDEMRGRVTAVHSMCTGTSNQLGDFESGVTAALFGVVPAVLLGGAGTVLVALLWMVLFPDLRRMRTLDGRP